MFWKSNGVSFNPATEELKVNFKVVDNVISDKHVKSFVKYEYDPKKSKPPLTYIIVYHLETYSKDKALPYYS